MLHPTSVMRMCQSSPPLHSRFWFLMFHLPHRHPRETSQKVSSVFCPLFCCSVTKLCPTLCDQTDCSMPGSSVLHCLPEFCSNSCPLNRWISHPTSYPLLSPSPPAFNLSQPQGLFQRDSSSHQVAEVLELQVRHLSFQ